jgi:VWFA-related protein
MTICAMGQMLTAPRAGSAVVRMARANTSESEASNASFTLRRKVEEVSVRFIATDKAGAAVRGIDAADLRIFDDREEVRELKSFGRARRQPLRIGIMVDLSDSIRPDEVTQRLTALDLLSDIFDASRDKAFVVGFSNHSELLQDATGNMALIRQSMQKISAKQGLTSLFDAMVETCRSEFAEDGAGADEKRIMLLFSDGVDTLSIHGLDEAMEAALRAKVTIYALTTASNQREGLPILRALTERTGGRAYVLRQKHDVDKAVAGITQTDGEEYTITFRPATGRIGFHVLRLEVPAHSELQLRAASGYFLDPQ